MTTPITSSWRLALMLTILVLLTGGLRASAAAPGTQPKPPATAENMRVRIDGLDSDPSLRRDVLAVCRDVAGICATTMPSGPALGPKPFVIRSAPDGSPRADLRGLPGEYWINITCLNSRSYSQIVYQVGHEMGHHYVGPRQDNWFVESAATALSYASLTEMGNKWEHHPPFGNWASYAKHFHEYRLETIRSMTKEAGLEDVQQAGQWVKTRLPGLVAAGKVDRPAQAVCAFVIEQALRRHPDSWSALSKLGAAVNKEQIEWEQWRKSVSEQEAPLVDDLRQAFAPVAAPAASQP